MVSVFCKVLGKLLIGNVLGLFESIHSLPDFHVDPSIICCKCLELILLDDFVGDD